MSDWQRAWDRVRAGEPVVGIGLMSGTSADGIDAAAVEIRVDDGRPVFSLRAFETVPYPPSTREALFRCFAGEATVREVCLLNGEIGELFADAAEVVITRTGPTEPPAFVASHGQTVWHEPADAGAPGRRGTLQLGEAARIATRLGVPVVSDFRQQDFALGGQGAPLVPYLDFLLFSSPSESRALQNLGGIGNVAYLPAGGGLDAVIAFDTGPANVLMDAAAALVTAGAQSYDRDGCLAAGTAPDPQLLERLLQEPYFRAAPPKSTGRELFTAASVEALWGEGWRGDTLVSTLAELTVESIGRAYDQWLGPIDRVILAGGGARNPELVRRLARRLAPRTVQTIDTLGVDAEAKESIAFAVMGYETLRGRPSNVPAATGAARPAIQGKITLP